MHGVILFNFFIPSWCYLVIRWCTITSMNCFFRCATTLAKQVLLLVLFFFRYYY
ncbi:hypothetical protein BDA96_03G462200 [Sorghum bicolor]|uniref:Uncharacterized protein n=1 Tax=Sorghum bicolor TaxID=4558 RepID=A0A921UTD8_SORBI|nr:hypothetical protein BDA96_03G462200 [Sorghum bicolor]